MISERLIKSVVCASPLCRLGLTKGPQPREAGLRCPRCGRVYAINAAGYLDLMPPDAGAHTSLYVSHEADFEAALDYKRIAMPLLGAAVRQRAIRRMLKPQKNDRLVELGCGNGKFVYWNRMQVDWAVGVDPAPLFASEALEKVDLCRADARALPFEAGAFTAAISIDVLEHLPLPDIVLYLREAHRTLAPGGRIFIFSNTREGSRLDFIARGARVLSRRLGEVGIIDDSRDRLRKSDHVKAIATYQQLEEIMRGCGFKVEQVVFWNGLFQSVIENLVMKLAEAAMRRYGRGTGRSLRGRRRDEAMRSSVKRRLARKGVAYRAMLFLTELMWLDLALFGKWRAGPYFLLARREEPL
ncbi:MAG: class I SAM-dependent methyltransferase [Chloroflexi bacterium]|nr:class I SAM-dependent methyltransferase [Chloroflexota bacterium]